jgi:hypothetical protein
MPNGKQTNRILLVFSNQDQLALLKGLLKDRLSYNECIDCANISEASSFLKLATCSFDLAITEFSNTAESDIKKIKEYVSIDYKPLKEIIAEFQKYVDIDPKAWLEDEGYDDSCYYIHYSRPMNEEEIGKQKAADKALALLLGFTVLCSHDKSPPEPGLN